ncbi:MAG: heme-copper oxidase subunit III [Opitutae bacterium]|jgi:heme/copper-type cytochrome/quinol oxidase subunit 3|nr:heme-copper oxidase subunit III [Opitutae bacterium]
MSDAATHALEHHEPVTSTGIPSKKILMWAFLGSDCMFFGTLISTHLIYRKISATVGSTTVDIRNIFDIELTSFSTFILLASSLFMALAVSAIHKGNLTSTRWMLLGTIIFGSIFLACQVYEFTHFVTHEGHELTLSHYQGQDHVFGSTFYVLTGTHGTHVAIGVFWLLGWLVYSFTGKMSTADAMDIECCGLYWHFVDIVWIIIFPVVYLMEYAF